MVGLDTLHTKLFLQQEHQVVGSYRLRKATDHALASRDTFHLLLLSDEREVLETQLLSDLIVDAPHGTVHISMHRHDDDATLDGLEDRPLHIVAVRYARKFAEDEGMVGNNQITTARDGLVNDGLRHVKTQ